VFQASLFINRPDRINFVMYGPETSYYSLDTKVGRHYQITFPADLKVDVPGGYGRYRVGSLGKLAHLDENAHLVEKTFAATTTTFIHYYFLPSKDEVYYGKTVSEETYTPSIRDILFESGNAGLLDRIYIALSLVGENGTSFTMIRYLQDKNALLGESVFREDTFKKNSLGLLYQTRYRDEQQSVQIQYPAMYRTAARIGSLLEGNGIRVSDISLDIKRSNHCEVIYSSDTVSQTAEDIGRYFSCPLKKGKTDVYDILFILGKREKDWQIRQ